VASILLLFVAVAASIRHGTIDVGGRVTCNGKPLAGVEVQIVDNANFGDKVATKKTGHIGFFEITGTAKNKVFDFKPQLIIKHNCNYKGFPSKTCKRQHAFDLPQSYIAPIGVLPNRYIMNELDMRLLHKGEKDNTKCH
ncbi:hypothetical protein PMAYCL1PPCAC_17167, partial [Pristionchus mayeri]